MHRLELRVCGVPMTINGLHGPWAACDAYVLVRTEHLPHLRKDMECEYYIKFAIGKTGTVLLLASCHLPEDRRL